MGSGTVDITLTLNNKDGYKYKPLDVIRGRVHLKVLKEISVKEVTVKFEGISTSEFQVRENRYNASTGTYQQRHVTKREQHTIAYDGAVIFPPPNVRNVSTSKEFTLTPGEYSYDFAFKIPLQNDCAYKGGTTSKMVHGATRLPPSMGIEGVGRINYQVRVTVKRASWFRTNPREVKNPMITCFDPIDDIITYKHPFFLRESFVFTNQVHKRIALTEKPTGPESYEIPIRESSRKKSSHFIKSLFGNKGPAPKFAKEYDVPFTLEVRQTTPFLKIGQVPDLEIYITSKYGPNRYRGIDNQTSGLGEFILENISMELIGTYSVVAEGRFRQEERPYRLLNKRDLLVELDLANLEPNPLHGSTSDSNPYQLAIPKELYKDAVVIDVVKPTFDTCNIKVDYKLNIKIKFIEDKKSWRVKVAEFLTPVTVTTGIPAPQEYIQMRQIPPELAQQILTTYPTEAFRQADEFTPLYDDSPVAPISLNVVQPEPQEYVEKKQSAQETLPAYESAIKDQ